jgi:hypothetical protein
MRHSSAYEILEKRAEQIFPISFSLGPGASKIRLKEQWVPFLDAGIQNVNDGSFGSSAAVHDDGRNPPGAVLRQPAVNC